MRALPRRTSLFKKTLESFQSYRNDQLPWWQVAEFSFDSFMLAQRGKG